MRHEYSKEYGEMICERFASNKLTLEQMCDQYEDMPNPDTIYTWVHTRPEFAESFARAKKTRAHLIADKIEKLEKLADEYIYLDMEKNGKKLDGGIVGELKRRMAFYMWQCEKFNPEYYGKKEALESANSINESVKSVKESMDRLVKEREKPY